MYLLVRHYRSLSLTNIFFYKRSHIARSKMSDHLGTSCTCCVNKKNLTKKILDRRKKILPNFAIVKLYLSAVFEKDYRIAINLSPPTYSDFDRAVRPRLPVLGMILHLLAEQRGGSKDQRHPASVGSRVR